METIIYKINQKFDKKLYEKKKSLDIKYCKMLDTRKYKLDTKRERELSSYIRKREKQKRYELKLAKSKEKIKENKKINKEILR